MNTHKKLRNKLKKYKSMSAASRSDVDRQDHRHAETLDSEPKEPARLFADASGHTSSPVCNNIPNDDDIATRLPHEQMGPSTHDSIFPSNSFMTFSEKNHSASTYMTRRSLDKVLEKQREQQDLDINERAVLVDSTPEVRKTTKQTDDTLVVSSTQSQDADDIEHPFKVYYQRSRPGLAGGLIHAWKQWECCHCGSVTHYENHFCSRLACCHKRCEAQCTTLEASG